MAFSQPLRVLMLCAHEPSLDPRIRWEAEGAAKRFEVTVLGFDRPDRPLAESAKVCGYRIVRLKPHRVSALYYLRRLTGIMPRTISLPLLAAFYLLSPALLAGEGLAWLGRMVRD